MSFASTHRKEAVLKATDFFLHRACSTGLIAVLIFAAPGCGRGRKIPGLENFHADVLQSSLYVSFVATQLKLDQGLTAPIPGLNDATVSVSPDLNSDGTVLQFTVPLASLLNQGRPLPALGLPDGRGLPDIAGGRLPRWDFKIDQLSMSAYLSDDAFGLFIPILFKTKTGIKLPYLISVSVQDERGNKLGKAYAIPANASGDGSGVLILLPYLGGNSSGS